MPEPRVRTCVACGTSGTKATLVRVVRTSEGAVRLDPSGKAPGRGAYLCQSRACFDNARKRRSLDRTLRVRVGEADMERLEQEFDMLCSGHGDAQ